MAWGMKSILSLILCLSFLTLACGSTSQARRGGAFKPKPFVTPWEYYQTARTADFTQEDEAKVQQVEEVHSTHGDTPSDHKQAIIIGVAVGLVVIGGAVTGILLAK